jgi:hypothetical protein
MLAGTAALHETIAALSSRVRQLEEALMQYDPQHPLISEEQLRIDRMLEQSEDEPAPKPMMPSAEDVTDALGSLSVYLRISLPHTIELCKGTSKTGIARAI